MKTSKWRRGASLLVMAQVAYMAHATWAVRPARADAIEFDAVPIVKSHTSVNSLLSALGPDEDPAEEEAEDQAEEEAEEQAEDAAEEQAEEEAEDQAEEEAEDQAEEEAEDQAEEEAEDQAEEEAEDQAEEEAEDQAEEEAEEQAEEEAEEQAEEEAEDQAEQEAEDQAEQEAEDQAEQEAENQAEQEAEDQAEQEAEDQAEQEAEEQAEEEAEDQAEQEAEDQAEQEAEDQAEEEAEEQAEEEAEDQAEQEAEEQAEEEAEDQAEQEAEEQAEEEAEDQAEQEAEDQAEQEAEDQAEQEAEDQAEQEAEDQAEQEAEDQAEQEAEDQAEEQAEEEVEDQAEELEDAAEEAADDAEEAAEEAVEAAEDAVRKLDEDQDEAEDRFEEAEDRLADRIARDDDAESRVTARGRADDAEEKAAARFSAARVVEDRDYLEIEEEIGESFIADEIIYLAEMDRAEAIEMEALEDKSVEYLEGLDMVLVRAKSSRPEELDTDIEALGNLLPTGAADRNHLYSAEAASATPTKLKNSPVALARKLQFDVQSANGVKIGLIDTAIAADHVLFAGGSITSRDFVAYEASRPKGHGTAVASILIGRDDNGFFGLVPDASLYAASVFFETEKGRQVATAESLVRALDWMLRENVQVVNMSLSGPRNQLVEVAVRRAAERGLTIVAAVGNAGPSAKPLYPAAIESVVAVTAVDANDRVFLRANRGRHVDIAAPGVAIDTADATGGYKANTGTSIAAPFVAAMLVQLAQEEYSGDPAKAFEAIKARATDLGDPGFDEIYGYGLIRMGTQ